MGIIWSVAKIVALLAAWVWIINKFDKMTKAWDRMRESVLTLEAQIGMLQRLFCTSKTLRPEMVNFLHSYRTHDLWRGDCICSHYSDLLRVYRDRADFWETTSDDDDSPPIRDYPDGFDLEDFRKTYADIVSRFERLHGWEPHLVSKEHLAWLKRIHDDPDIRERVPQWDLARFLTWWWADVKDMMDGRRIGFELDQSLETTTWIREDLATFEKKYGNYLRYGLMDEAKTPLAPEIK